jgi:prepilin signal peptidase PulO-like enzyme (type II secretory pathway)
MMIIYLALIIIGLCFGSFINALVWRLHKQDELVDKKHKKTNSKLQASNYSILNGRSMCPDCKHQLKAIDLIPVASWIMLKGKCRYCKKPISWQYPVIELLTAFLFVFSWVFWPAVLTANWQYFAFITWLIILIGLISMAIYDTRWMILPDKILYFLTLIMIGSYLIQFSFDKPAHDATDIFFAAVIGCGFFGLIYLVSRGKWIGFGDVKLGFLLGLIVATPVNIFITLFLSSILGMFWIMPLLAIKKLKPTSHIPFGPFLISAAVIVVLFGQNIVDLYRSLLLI